MRSETAEQSRQQKNKDEAVAAIMYSRAGLVGERQPVLDLFLVNFWDTSLSPTCTFSSMSGGFGCCPAAHQGA